ncbi:HNH endonuclease [Paenibacillus sp. P25]|nr:HNH endonuclease [Paenibacillus sp. P25]
MYCERNGRLTPTIEVDHIIPHKGNKQLFWDKGN